MKYSQCLVVALLVVIGYMSQGALAQQNQNKVKPISNVPSVNFDSDQFKKTQQKENKKIEDIFNKLGDTPTAAYSMPQIEVPTGASAKGQGVDPAKLAQQYANLGKTAKSEDEVPQLMVFVSLSMPESSLIKLGKQVRKANGVLVFRGLKYGLQKGKYIKSIEALKPVATTNVNIMIHPELFKRYNIQSVPTFVVAEKTKPGCQDDACATRSAALRGDVSLDYALEKLAARNDAVGVISKRYLNKLN